MNRKARRAQMSANRQKSLACAFRHKQGEPCIACATDEEIEETLNELVLSGQVQRTLLANGEYGYRPIRPS